MPTNTAQTIDTQTGAKTPIAATPASAPPALGLPAATSEMLSSPGIRMIAEPVAAAARLTGHSRVLIAGCRLGDGASSVAGALALDLAVRLGIDTLLIDADPSGGRPAVESRPGGNGRPAPADQTSMPHLWTMRCGTISEPTRPPSGNGERSSGDDTLEELRKAFARYRAAVIDLGVVRLNAHMLALARPDDPVLVVARYRCTQRDELASTLAVIGVANLRAGGVILNGYESPGADRLRWLASPGRDGR